MRKYVLLLAVVMAASSCYADSYSDSSGCEVSYSESNNLVTPQSGEVGYPRLASTSTEGCTVQVVEYEFNLEFFDATNRSSVGTSVQLLHMPEGGPGWAFGVLSSDGEGSCEETLYGYDGEAHGRLLDSYAVPLDPCVYPPYHWFPDYDGEFHPSLWDTVATAP